MTQQTRNIISGVLLAFGLVAIVFFTVTHFTSPGKFWWRRDFLWLGVAAVLLARPIRRSGSART